MSQKTVTVSVRRLRSGDIDTVSGTFGEMDAMQQGGLMHRKLQKEAGPSYRAATAGEVPLSILTAMVGAPFFAVILRKTSGGRE